MSCTCARFPTHGWRPRPERSRPTSGFRSRSQTSVLGNLRSALPSSSRRNAIVVLALVAASACAGSSTAAPRATASPRSTAAGTDVNGTLQSGNFTRSYVLHLPPDSSRLRPTPIVIAFHGSPMTAEQMSRITHLSQVADAHGFAVLFPQGYQKSWAVPGGSTPAQQAGIDDVAFVRALLDSAGQLHGLDPMRVVATGISNGGCRWPDSCGAIPRLPARRPDLSRYSGYTASMTLLRRTVACRALTDFSPLQTRSPSGQESMAARSHRLRPSSPGPVATTRG
ncbi:MAG: hypothetical protein E6J46_04825 [Chloroflexi bacterium]|nr:MAG: hypothetical protein E6J46_04825 [Chloroflexota bacterium]